MKRLRRLMALGLSLCMLVPLSLRASAASMPFRDVPADSFAYDDILSLAERGIVQGIGDGLYGTYEPFKRCDFVLMLARLMGWQTDGQTPQATDVPQGHYAAALIDQCGLKGLTIGGAQVSAKHAGFIVNIGMATCRDVLYLIGVVRDCVYRVTGVELEPEVKYLK